MYRNASLIIFTKQIFYLFLWPYYLIESFLGMVNPDGSHNFHIIVTPLGLLLSLVYIVIAGNVVYSVVSWIKRR
ncbi:MAG: hypothetical protein CVU48_01190 [Candidatus Cloacimonetes bacterium HGW-Cloacimonetes-1]|nr:MAG: hypothetical protein CVU48_01190 [Candidatus Cloacimonetes bacterium HGW-Cloacimonetes-1]